jgi:sulfur-oxidizing protein SoxA
MRMCIAALFWALAVLARADPPGIPAAEQRSGSAFLSEDLRAMQADDFANPGMLWVARGEKMWTEVGCESCHAKGGMRGVAIRYPLVADGRLLNLEGRINQCRTERQKAPPYAYESDELLALTAYVAQQSRGLAPAPRIDGAAQAYFAAGRERYFTRLGQMNLACAHCHDRNWGRHLLGETMSQGQANGYPAYRLEWQRVGSLHRRLRACNFGVRAEMLPGGAQDYLEIELYLAWRAQRLTIETPAVRR